MTQFFVTSFFIVGFIVLAAQKIRAYLENEKHKKAQENINRGIETRISELCLTEIDIDLLAGHSDEERVAKIIAVRVKECFKVAAHPEKLQLIFNNLGIFDTERNNRNTHALKLIAVIKQEILRKVSTNDMETYHMDISHDKEKPLREWKGNFTEKNQPNVLKTFHNQTN